MADTYGSTEANAAPKTDEVPLYQENVNFDESNMYYVKPTKMSRNQWIALIFPLVIAALLVGGAMSWMFSFWGNMSPRSHPSYLPPSTPIVPSETTTTSTSTTTSIPAPTKPSTTAESACSAHPKCYDLELIGECCPTPDGTTLGCC